MWASHCRLSLVVVKGDVPDTTWNARPPYSGLAEEMKQGNITTTMNRRATIASCIVVASTFYGEGAHQPS